MKTWGLLIKGVFLALVLLGITTIPAGAESVYLIGADVPLDNQVASGLATYGDSVTIGPTYDAFNGSASLSSYSAVLLMPTFGGNGTDMPSAGQSALLSYVNGGGGLVTTEWSIWLAGTGRLTALQAAFPATSGGVYDYAASATYFQKVANSVIDQNLPAASYTFSPLFNEGGTESALTPVAGADVFFESSYAGGASDSGFAGLVGGTYGSGHVMSFSTLVDVSDSNYMQLLANSLNWAAGASVPVPEPVTLLLLGPGLVGLAAIRRRCKK